MRKTNATTRIRRGPKRKPRNKVRLNYWLLISWFLISVGVSSVITYALKTPDLAIKEVKIYGVKLANRAVIESVGRRALGKNIILLRKTPILDEIARLSEIRDVRMGRRFPNGIWIEVCERKPYAIVRDMSGYCMVQSNGFVFHKINKPVKGVPVINIDKRCRLTSGRTVSSAVVLDALESLKLARKERIGVTKISVDHVGDICLNMGSAFYVKLGQPDDIARKMSLLRSALAFKPSLARDAEYIDISCPSAPVWKPKVVAQIP